MTSHLVSDGKLAFLVFRVLYGCTADEQEKPVSANYVVQDSPNIFILVVHYSLGSLSTKRASGAYVLDIVQPSL